MANLLFQKPKKRSRLRVLIGRLVFSCLRSLQWATDRSRLGRLQPAVRLPVEVCAHQSPLFRPLAGVDPQLQHNKVTNLRLAVARLDGLVLQPGEVFSYWRLIGRPSRRRGFIPGLVLINGRPDAYPGGGLCQLSNLIYWLTLHSPLTVTERWRHSYDVFPDAGRTLPFGSGATCVYNYRDLRIENRTTQAFQLRLALTATDLTGGWLSEAVVTTSYRVVEKQHWFSQTPYGQYMRNNLLHREVYQDGHLVGEEYVTENHALMMYPPFLSKGSPA